MNGGVLEINQSKKVAGRTNIKWILLEVHQSPDQYNKNGIHWKEDYIVNNLDSVRNMPIVAEFLDEYEKDIPHGHGLADVKDGMPIFTDSVVVGTTERGYIDTVEVNGRIIRALIAEGYIYNQRYPEFVGWMKDQIEDGTMPDTSVEICGQDGNGGIEYFGGWKEKGRIPQVFDFSGSAILGIEPADDSAVLLEINKFKEDKKMSKELIAELNSKIDGKDTEINKLKVQAGTKDTELNELGGKLEKKTNELNTVIQELNDKKKELEGIQGEVNELREFKQKTEGEKLVAELNEKLSAYTDEEKSVSKDKIETFSKSPSAEKVSEIVNEINSDIAKKIVEDRKKKQATEDEDKKKKDKDDKDKKSEQNSYIFGDILEEDAESSIDELL